jgi:hypothetical protein
MSKRLINSNSTTEFRTSESLSDEALDSVVGGLNPQPLPPRVFYSYSAFTAIQAAAVAGIIFR